MAKAFDIHGYGDVPIGVRIMANRKRWNMSQQQLGEAVGCTQSAISQIENGERDPSWDLVNRIANALQASIVWRPWRPGKPFKSAQP